MLHKTNNFVFYPCDASHYFDRIAIQEIKLEKCDTKEKPILAAHLKFLINNLSEQIGDIKYEAIKKSIDFKKLKHINKEIFDLIIHSKNYNIEFKVANELNNQRFKIKQEIQKKYFNKSLSEIKIYEQ